MWLHTKKYDKYRRGTLHKVVIYECCVSLEVRMCHNYEYNLFKSVELDDPSIKKIGEVVTNFIM